MGGRRIVVTRDPAASGRVESELRQAGFVVAHCPLTTQCALDDDAPLTRAVRAVESGTYDVLMLTSANTVRAMHRVGWGGRLGLTHRNLRPEIAVTGAGTAQALRTLIGDADPWRPVGEASAAGILAELRTPAPGERLLLPQSLQARSELASGLTARGWRVDQVPAYRTVALYGPQARVPDADQRLHPADGAALSPHALRPEDLVLITSSSAAEVWVQTHSAQRPPHQVLAIGAPTAATLEALGRPADAVLSSPTAAGVAAALSC